MAVRCSACKIEYDITLFEFGSKVKCDCGRIISLEHRETFDGLLKTANKVMSKLPEYNLEEDSILEIKRMADKIAYLIVSADYPDIDIQIEKNKFAQISELFPDKIHLYDLIYEPRFTRLKEQFRKD